MSDNKSERQKIIDRGNFGMYHKPLAQEIGLNATVILDFLIYKYDYFVGEKKEFLSYGKYKAFFITYQDIEDATTIKVSTLSRNKASNPLVILEKYGLIKRKMEYYNFKKIYYYILFFDKIHKAINLSLQKQENKKVEKKEVDGKWEKKIAEKRRSEILQLLKEARIPLEDGFKANENKNLHNSSTHDVKTTESEVSNDHIIKNRNNNNKIIKNRNSPGNTNPKKIKEELSDGFSEEELDKMLNPEKYGEIFGYPNCNNSAPQIDHPQLLYKAIYETRLEVMSIQDFFETITGVILKDKFKGFKMSTEDQLLIYEAIINNPMFEYENEDIEDRNEQAENLKLRNKNISQEDIEIEVDFNKDRYEHLYNHLWEKIRKNCQKINEGKLKARFGNVFVGVREFSENYTHNMARN